MPRRPIASGSPGAGRFTVHVLIATGCWLACSGCHGSTVVPGRSQRPSAGATASRTETPPPSPADPTITASVDLADAGPPVPRDFLGLSFEASSIPLFAQLGSRGNLVGLLRSLGPGLLRFGGVSADTQTVWSDAQTPAAPWATTTVDRGDLLGLRRLAQASGWRIVLTIGLAHFEPVTAAREAAAAEQTLGSLLAGVELGNEPDAYARHALRSEPWTLARYDADIDAYRSAIAGAAPSVALFGPDLSGSLIFKHWGDGYARAQRPALLTGHHYPLGCHETPSPSIALLLSPGIRRAEDQSLERYMAVARETATPFRLDETGSVSCGGSAGISDTFASALWALDYIGHTMAAGAAGINFEGNLSRCGGYSPLCAATPQALAEGELSARPEWYALLAARTLVGERPLRVTRSAGAADVDVLASIGATQTLHVLIVEDERAHSAVLSLRVPGAYRSATALSLTAGSVASTEVQLGGRTVHRAGSWHAADQPSSLPVDHGRLTLALRPASATLLTLRESR